MTKNPLQTSVKERAALRVDLLGRRHGITDRCGGPQFRQAARARLEALEDVETHIDDNALDEAAAATARALLLVERAQLEHEDASAKDVLLDRVHVLLVEAAMGLECLAHVNVHAERIRAARARAVDQENAPPVPPREPKP